MCTPWYLHHYIGPMCLRSMVCWVVGVKPSVGFVRGEPKLASIFASCIGLAACSIAREVCGERPQSQLLMMLVRNDALKSGSSSSPPATGSSGSSAGK